MFGAKYSRLKYWIISLILLFLFSLFNQLAESFERNENLEDSGILYIMVLIVALLWTNTLANRIRDYGSNPWLSLLSIIPFVNIILGFYYGIRHYKNTNTAKDLSSQIKPIMNDCKEKHSTTTFTSNSDISENNIELNEDEIYENIMIEIEENKRVKSTWAKALAQSDGDDKKANSLYINLRVNQIKEEDKKLLLKKRVHGILDNINDLEKYGYTFLSSSTVRKNGKWDEYTVEMDAANKFIHIKKDKLIIKTYYSPNSFVNHFLQ